MLCLTSIGQVYKLRRRRTSKAVLQNVMQTMLGNISVVYLANPPVVMIVQHLHWHCPVLGSSWNVLPMTVGLLH
jgi:hypothetical protein